jgi:predicted amidohydrolase
MRICAAQPKPIKGDIQANIESHKRFINLALVNDADLIIFPELSLTGYEPTLAKQLATTPDDGRLNEFQTISTANQITIGVGIPTINHPRPTISMVIFQPNQPRITYFKQHIHADEEPYFVNGRSPTNLISHNPTIALAICYEIAVPQHAQAAHDNGAEIYLASVAKTINGIEPARKRLSEIARIYSMTVIMSNCVGLADGQQCAGKSSIWNNKGQLLGQLNDTDEGIIIYDSSSQEITSETIKC